MKNIFALSALALLIAACGADVEGTWRGTYTDTNSRSGNLLFEMTQSGSDVTGTLTSFGLPCLDEATVTGSVDGDQIHLDGARGESSVTFNGTVNENQISGTFTIPATGSCVGGQGTWTVNR
jgi:opacity protein-like surface antigen